MGKETVGDLWESADWLSDDLAKDEAVLWAGRPRSARSSIAREVPTAVVGLLVTGLGLGTAIAILAANLGGPGGPPGLPSPATAKAVVAACLVIWSLPVGLLLAAAPLFAYRRMSDTYYTLTNLRAIVVEPDCLGRPRVESFDRARLAAATRVDRDDGTADLIFAHGLPRPGWSRLRGFVGIDEARRVEVLIRSTSFAERGRGRALPEIAWEDHPPRRTYRLALPGRAFAFVLLALGVFGWTMVLGWVVAPLVLISTFAVLPGAARTTIDHAANGGIGPVMNAIATWLVSVPFGAAWSWFFVWAAGYQVVAIDLDEDGTIAFRGWARTIRRAVADLTEVPAPNGPIERALAAWLDPFNDQKRCPTVRYRGGKIPLFSTSFERYDDLVARLEALNPAINVTGR